MKKRLSLDSLEVTSFITLTNQGALRGGAETDTVFTDDCEPGETDGCVGMGKSGMGGEGGCAG